jgi:hypothetical protein
MEEKDFFHLHTTIAKTPAYEAVFPHSLLSE